MKLQAVSTIRDTKVPEASLLHLVLRVAPVGVLKGNLYLRLQTQHQRHVPWERGGEGAREHLLRW